MGLLLVITSVYFLTTGIQFWITDYWVTILNQSKTMAYIYFATCAITGPVGGVVSGGLFFNYLGGFENYRSFHWAVIIMTIGSLSALPLPFVTEITLSAVILWF
jgi:hypothetical protein